jgi:hypothetical protein
MLNLSAQGGNQIGLYTQGWWSGSKTDATTNTWYRISTIMSASNGYARINGTQYMVATSGGYALGGFRLACGDNDGENGNIDIAEVIIYNSALSVSDTEGIEQYLKSKYGL